uniref:Uncharacterized protein n=1 Tax=Aegilops tauschii TaxID=37682 RepID=M8BPX6_AEGTA
MQVGIAASTKPMPLKTVDRTEAAGALHHQDKYNSKGATVGSLTGDPDDPWNPPRPPPHPWILALECPHQFSVKYMRQIADFLSEVRAANIIVPDRTPKERRTKFYEIFDRFMTTLEKDSALGFLRLFDKYRQHLVYGYVITPQSFNLIIAMNALRCAKFVLKGKAPRLCGMRANPNYITNFGFFPLHQAVESFSADMVEVLLQHGALANLRTSGNIIIEGLLPLHVAIENTCQHKYLEDNLLADQNYMKGNVEYIYKLIYLLCLPEMKIFLDTTRVLASHTDNVVDELWDCIKHGKLVPAAILLFAAHRHFRKLNGFDTIKTLIEDSVFDLEREGCGLKSGKNTKAAKQRKEKKVQFSNTLVLVRIILKAGDALDEYIQTHSKASHEEVLAKVSEVLQNYDVGPSGKAAKRKPRRGQNLWYARDQFLPVWRSVLTCQFNVRTFPSYAPRKEMPDTRYDGVQKKATDRRSSSNVRLGMLDLLESRSQKLASGPKSATSYRSRRPFGTAASTVLKMLKRA